MYVKNKIFVWKIIGEIRTAQREKEREREGGGGGGKTKTLGTLLKSLSIVRILVNVSKHCMQYLSLKISSNFPVLISFLSFSVLVQPHVESSSFE